MIALRYKHYLAVSPLTSQKHTPVVGSRLIRPDHSCIQIWSLSPSQPETPNSDDDPGIMRCEMVVCIEAGSAFELRWCPLPSHDDLSVRILSVFFCVRGLILYCRHRLIPLLLFAKLGLSQELSKTDLCHCTPFPIL